MRMWFIGIIIALFVLFLLFSKYKRNKLQAEALAAGEPTALLNHGLALINQGEIDPGIEHIQQAADKGLALAALALGELYSGKFPPQLVPVDTELSNNYYRKAAELDPQYLALLTLPNLLSSEAKTTDELIAQVKQLKPSAESGQVEFQYELALLYLWQSFLDPDGSQAIYWFEKAAEQGSEKANYYLGALYWNDKRVTSDHNKAREYFEKAVAYGAISTAKESLGQMLATGQGGPKDLIRAEALLTEYAEDNDFYQYILGKRFLYGEDFSVDYNKARHWLEKACVTGNVFAKITRAELRLLAPQNDDDYQQAKTELEKFAPLWHEEALFNLGKIHEQGLGISRQSVKALMYYQLAAMSHNLDYQAAFDRLSNELSTLERREAQNLCDSYLEQHPIPAQIQSYYDFNQAMLFYKEGGETLQTAEAWFRKSADLGNQDAMQVLVEIYRHQLINKPVQVFIWSSILRQHFGQYGMNNYQLLYQQQALSRLTESELLYAQSEIENIEAQLTPYLVEDE